MRLREPAILAVALLGVALLGVALLGVALLATPAAAHAVLVASDPVSGASLGQAPGTVELRFSEDLAPAFSSAGLIDGDGRPVDGARVAAGPHDPRLLVIELPAVPPGAYGMTWRVLAEDDGHTTTGAIVWGVGGAAADVAVPAASGYEVARPLDVARRWVWLCLLSGLIGALAVARLVLGPAGAAAPSALQPAIRSAQRRVLALATACATVAVAVGFADIAEETARQSAAAGGAWTTFVQLTTATRWGHLWLARQAALAGLAVLALALRSGISARSRRAGRIVAGAAVTLVLVLASAEALGGHAAALGSAAAVAVTALHVLTACVWLGALPALAVTLWPARGRQAPAGLLLATRGAFTGLAAGSAGLVAVTGLYSAGRQVETVEFLVTTAYGRALLAKGVLLVLLGGLGLVNAAALHGRRPARRGPIARRVVAGRPSRPLVVLEACAGAILLIAVGVLLETPPARGLAGPDVTAPAAVPLRHGGVDDLVTALTVTPNRPGLNGFTLIVASARRPPPAPVDRVALEVDDGVVALREVAPGRWFGTAPLDQAGPVRIRAAITRAGDRLEIPMAWEVGATAAAAPRASGHRLAPYADGIGLALLAALLGVAVGRLRRRRSDPLADDRVLAGGRGGRRHALAAAVRDMEQEGGAVAELAGDLDPPAAGAHRVTDDREPEPAAGPRPGRAAGAELVEDVGEILAGDPRA